MKKLITCIVLILTVSIFTSTALAADAGFSDVKSSDWYYKYVTELSSAGIINGYPDGTFKPDNTVTHGEALKLITLAAGYPVQSPIGEHWASGYRNFAYIMKFAEIGYLNELDAPVSRLLIASIAAKTLGLTKSKIKSPFSDTKSVYVLALYEKGIIEGSLNDKNERVFCPDESIKRSEMSAIIRRIMDLMSDSGSHEGQIKFGSQWLGILEDVPVSSYDDGKFSTKDGIMQYDSDTVQTFKGIDVSSYQGEVDWKKVSASGVDFVMIRLGFRGYGTGTLNLDDYFERNIKGATAAGLKVGVYFFSQAVTETEALEEANFVLSRIKGYKISYPVAFDWETISGVGARTDGISTATLCKCANAFCKRVADAGYKPLIYFNSYCGYIKYDLSKIMSYDFWLAEYSPVPAFYYDFRMWQYTSSGSVPGIAGRVDMNISMKKYA